jgi:hypothetical protein
MTSHRVGDPLKMAVQRRVSARDYCRTPIEELIHHKDYQSRVEARASIFE